MYKSLITGTYINLAFFYRNMFKCRLVVIVAPEEWFTQTTLYTQAIDKPITTKSNVDLTALMSNVVRRETKYSRWVAHRAAWVSHIITDLIKSN